MLNRLMRPTRQPFYSVDFPPLILYITRVPYHFPFFLLHFSFIGAVAQLGERVNGIHEVEGSIPFGSTMVVSLSTSTT